MHHYPGQVLPYEILPPGEMPQLVDPRNGFFVSANNDPAGTTLDKDGAANWQTNSSL